MTRSTPLRRATGEARASVPALKPRRCPVKKGGCGQIFAPIRLGQVACGAECAIAIGMRVRVAQAEAEARRDRKQTKAKLLDLKKLSHWEKRAERVVNKYVRLRDVNEGCCSCDKPATWAGKWNASHFRSVGAASAVRFHLWNIHKGCEQCNSYLSGNLAEYEPRLRAKIGDARVDWLRAQNQTVRYSREYLQRLHDVFARRCRRLEKRR